MLIKTFVWFQPHPNVDKKLFMSQSIIALKNPSKPFPLNQDAGILRWRFQTQDESYIPLSSKTTILPLSLSPPTFFIE